MAETQTTQKTVHSFVHTYDKDGKCTESRVIDMQDNGARAWLLKHHWWALTNGCMVGLALASKDDHDKYQLERLQELARKYKKAN